MSRRVQKVVPVTPISFERMELERLHQRVELLYLTLEDALEMESASSLGFWSPRVDLYESEEMICVEVELAGVLAEDLQIQLTPTELQIEGEKKRVSGALPIVSHFCCERLHGKFKRTVPLRWTINSTQATATLKDGLLRIALPKLVERRGKALTLKVINAEPRP
jgi:HSP20 family protein